MSRNAGRRLNELEQYRQAKTVMFFVTHASEISTERMIELAWAAGKDVVVPVVDKSNGSLRAARIGSLTNDLAAGTYGVREPKQERCAFVTKDAIDMVIVPGIAFDTSGQRIGYGKGCYDRWLRGFRRDQCVGLCFDFQIMEQLPRNTNDRAVGFIVTDKRTIVTRRRVKRRHETASHSN